MKRLKCPTVASLLCMTGAMVLIMSSPPASFGSEVPAANDVVMSSVTDSSVTAMTNLPSASDDPVMHTIKSRTLPGYNAMVCVTHPTLTAQKKSQPVTQVVATAMTKPLDAPEVVLLIEDLATAADQSVIVNDPATMQDAFIDTTTPNTDAAKRIPPKTTLGASEVIVCLQTHSVATTANFDSVQTIIDHLYLTSTTITTTTTDDAHPTRTTSLATGGYAHLACSIPGTVVASVTA